MKSYIFYSIPLLFCAATVQAQDVINHAVDKNINVNQMVIERKSDVKYYNANEVRNVDVAKDGKITVTTTSNATDTYQQSVNNIHFAKAIANASVEITDANGWQESAYAKWNLLKGADSYHVYVKGGQYNEYTRVDQELVRTYSDYGRVDVVGLRAGTYSLRVVPVAGNVEGKASEVSSLVVKNYDRSGFAHFNYKNVGAYNDDGTLKAGAVVVYVDKNNASTVTAKLSSGTFSGLQNIITAYEKGNVTTPLDIRIIGLIKKADVGAIGSSSEGIQIKGRKADSELNITIEGIGNDATIHGFGFLVRNTKSLEMRNLGIMRQMDDGISLDTDNSNIWIHNIDVFYGKAGSGDHAKGDGSIDVKADSKFVTVSYCHFWDSGKSSMCGMKSESGPNYITYHHNWFDHSDSRHARVRTMSVHLWNNYYDGCAKYGIGSTMGSSVFVESNYFRDTKEPMLISKQGTDAKGTGTFSGEMGGIIKGFGNVYAEKKASSYYTPIAYSTDPVNFDYYDAKTRDEQVPSSVVSLAGGNTYNNFDTNTSLMYSYTPDAANDVPAIVTGYLGAGRLEHGNLQFTFNNAVEDTNYAPIAALEKLIDNYAGEEVSHGSSDGGTEVDNGDDNGGEVDPTPAVEPVQGTVVCSFESKAPSSSLVSVTGNYSNSKGTATYNGVTYKNCVKMEQSTSITITTAQKMKMTLVFGDTETGSCKINGTKVTGTGSTISQEIAAGTTTITKANSCNLFAIVLEPLE